LEKADKLISNHLAKPIKSRPNLRQNTT